MNEWISLINYAGAFKTIEVPMLAPIASPISERPASVFSDSQEGSTVRSALNTPSTVNRDLESSRESLSPPARRLSNAVKWPAGEPGADSRLDYMKVSRRMATRIRVSR